MAQDKVVKEAPADELPKIGPKDLIYAVYGEMIDPTNHENPRVFTQKPELAGEVTRWMAVQVQAGKMKIDGDK